MRADLSAQKMIQLQVSVLFSLGLTVLLVFEGINFFSMVEFLYAEEAAF